MLNFKYFIINIFNINLKFNYFKALAEDLYHRGVKG